MQIDFHPGQFFVLNTPKESVFDAMRIQPNHSLVLHIGGVYGDKAAALSRFIENWALVPADIQKMIMLENDDKSLSKHFYRYSKLSLSATLNGSHHAD